MRWRDIRRACEDAGLPIHEWEDDLPERLLEYIIEHSGRSAQTRILYDAKFHAEMTKLVNLVMACIKDVDPLSEPMMQKRAEELGDLFRAEAFPEHD